jgi:hypothetical protein
MYFEYKMIEGLMQQQDLNQLGREGWELVAVINNPKKPINVYNTDFLYFFKRHRQP